MNVSSQLERGKLVCPKTGQHLMRSEEPGWLATADGTERYPLLHGQVPVLLKDTDEAARYVEASPKMVNEYREESLRRERSLPARLKGKLVQDYRSKASVEAFQRTFESAQAEPLFLSIGGGPKRQHPLLTNLNIGPFPNVDVVGDAHGLPYADGSVDAIFCEAVLEHLADPVRAVEEMRRVLRSGGSIFAATPFLQAYHGYPHHYQGFTVTGHRNLFESCGFEIQEAGTCVGPTYTMVSLMATYLNEYSPALLRRPAKILWGMLGALLRPLDRVLNERENAYVLASTTYLVARKAPVGSDDAAVS